MLNFISNLFTRLRTNNVRGGAQVRARYDAAQSTNDNYRHWANADGLSANASNSPEVRRTLRNRSRYEVANNSYARGIVLTLANDAIGTGPRLQLLTPNAEANRRIEREFSLWSRAVKREFKKLAELRRKIDRGTENLALADRDEFKAISKLLSRWRDEEAELADRLEKPDQDLQPLPDALKVLERLSEIHANLSLGNRKQTSRFDGCCNCCRYRYRRRYAGWTRHRNSDHSFWFRRTRFRDWVCRICRCRDSLTPGITEGTVSDSPSHELLYVVQGTEDDGVVRSLVAATSPTIYAGLKRDSYSVKPIGNGIWECAVQYSQFESDSQFTFDTGGGTQHVAQSLQTVGA